MAYTSDDLNYIKSEISLAAFACHVLGYEVDSKETDQHFKNIVLKRGEKTDDNYKKILVYRRPYFYGGKGGKESGMDFDFYQNVLRLNTTPFESSTKTGFDRDREDAGTIIDLIQIEKGWGLNRIVYELKEYTKNVEPNIKNYIRAIKTVPVKVNDLQGFNREYNIRPFKDLEYANGFISEYTKIRAFPAKIFNHPLFIDRVMVQEFVSASKYNFLRPAYAIYNPEGLCGFFANSFINETDEKSVKRIYGAKSDGLFFSNHDISRPINKFIITESPQDAISHFLLHKSEFEEQNLNVKYAASCGTLTSGQMDTLNMVINKLEPKEIILGFDNDGAGAHFTFQFLESFKSSNNKLFNDTYYFKSFISSKDHYNKINIQFSLGNLQDNKIYSQSIENKIKDINRYTDKISILTDSNKLDHFVKSIDNNQAHLLVEFYNVYKNFYSFNKLFRDMKFLDNNFIKIEVPYSKDFNLDLQINNHCKSDNDLIKEDHSFENRLAFSDIPTPYSFIYAKKQQVKEALKSFDNNQSYLKANNIKIS